MTSAVGGTGFLKPRTARGRSDVRTARATDVSSLGGSSRALNPSAHLTKATPPARTTTVATAANTARLDLTSPPSSTYLSPREDHERDRMAPVCGRQRVGNPDEADETTDPACEMGGPDDV